MGIDFIQECLEETMRNNDIRKLVNNLNNLGAYVKLQTEGNAHHCQILEVTVYLNSLSKDLLVELSLCKIFEKERFYLTVNTFSKLNEAQKVIQRKAFNICKKFMQRNI